MSTDIDRLASEWVLRRDTGLTVAEKEELELWQSVDARHQEAFLRKAKVWSSLDRPAQSNQADALLQRLEFRAQRRHYRRGMAIGVFLILLLPGLVWKFAAHRAEVRDIPRGIVLRPEILALPDGSIVELKSGAKVVAAFTANSRRVALTKGEALFAVAKDTNRPFVVSVGRVEFRAVGTEFSVERNEEAVQLLVTEGEVAVEATDTPGDTVVGATFSTRVSAGHRLAVPLASTSQEMPAPVAVISLEISNRLSWRAPRLEFSELPLAEAVAMMNEHNKVKFVIDSVDLARLPISGIFRADNTDTFVRLLEGTCGIHAVRSDESIILKKAKH